MSGNVFEWTCSQYKESYDGSEQECSDYDKYYSLRGGAWDGKPWVVRAADRNYNFTGYRGFTLGFRLARDK